MSFVECCLWFVCRLLSSGYSVPLRVTAANDAIVGEHVQMFKKLLSPAFVKLSVKIQNHGVAALLLHPCDNPIIPTSASDGRIGKPIANMHAIFESVTNVYQQQVAGVDVEERSGSYPDGSFSERFKSSHDAWTAAAKAAKEGKFNVWLDIANRKPWMQTYAKDVEPPRGKNAHYELEDPVARLSPVNQSMLRYDRRNFFHLLPLCYDAPGITSPLTYMKQVQIGVAGKGVPMMFYGHYEQMGLDFESTGLSGSVRFFAVDCKDANVLETYLRQWIGQLSMRCQRHLVDCLFVC
jgi:hypothetical protein